MYVCQVSHVLKYKMTKAQEVLKKEKRKRSIEETDKH